MADQLTSKEFNAIKRNIAGQLDILITKYGKSTIDDIKAILMSNHKRAFGKLINSIRFEKLDSRFVIVMEEYAQFVDRGSKTKSLSPTPYLGIKFDGLGKVRYTPLNQGAFFQFTTPTKANPSKNDFTTSIKKWIMKKGIVERKKGAIAHSIWRFGIKPTPFTMKITENNRKLQQEIAKSASLFVKIKMKTK
ncbi:hypothetical protein UFOVP163_3 [uncultured Caudovirales phage]|uniref:Uncharacterized protein n=1 Tax=uncultured Caudovirales phage TaxID=2100421 RepID=A0A6J7W9Z1_9CAUD|nr:hypothetical protein UFOVP163_3 [uncultured Caudovirales phage]